MLTQLPTATEAPATGHHKCPDQSVLLQLGHDPSSPMPGLGLGLRECQVCGRLEVVRVELDRVAWPPG